MSDERTKDGSKIQADNNSVAVGNLHINGSVAGSMIIGSNNVIGLTPEQVSALLTQISTTFQPKPFDGQCPYKGLDAFEENDADLFFGRERLVENLVGRVKESRTVFITGPSGSGKSSLVRAGLIHALKQGEIQESHSERWLYATMKPGRDPIDSLANALSRLKSPELGKYLRENAEQAGTLHECAESALTDQRDQRFVLFIDQFEEVFAQVNKDSEREKFLNLLTYAATKENGRLNILFSMRSDFVPNCATYPPLNNLLNHQFIQVGPMQPNELVSAIAQPALRVGLRIDPDLIVQVINEMQGQTGALPLMQFALKDLFDSQKEKGGIVSLTLDAYLKRGGIHKALERHADTSLAVMDEKERDLARCIFSGLIEVGRGTQDTRRTAIFKELIPSSEQAEEVQSIVRKLADARLITTDDQTVTISHEKLIDAWPWLKKLVNENRDVIALQNEIAEHAREWDEHRQDESYLYTGGRLINAREKLENKKLILSGLAQQFVSAGMELDDNKRRTEQQRQQKELEDAQKLAKIAQAQAKAERRARLITNGVLIAAIILVGILSYTPIRNEVRRQQAMGPALIPVPKSEAIIGDNQNIDGQNTDFLPPKTLLVNAFKVEPYEVTNKRYLLCVKARACSVPLAPSPTYMENDQLPVTSITAVQASQFCEWIGRQLPTELEWERAARYTDGRPWPWGSDVPTEEFASYYSATNDSLKPVGQLNKGKSEEGVYDLAGNVWEWTRSAYDYKQPNWEFSSSEPPVSLSVRGGDFQTNPITAMSGTIAYRYEVDPYSGDPGRGFRCVSH